MCKLSKEQKVIEKKVIELLKDKKSAEDTLNQYGEIIKVIQGKIDLLREISKEISNENEEI